MIIEADGWIDGEPFTVRQPGEFDLNTVDEPIGDTVRSWGHSLEPGDILFFRWPMNWWNVVSQTVSFMDGFFSHAGMYVGEGQVVDSGLGGVGLWSLEEIAVEFGADSCVVMARPRRPRPEREAAASWARGVARPSGDSTAIEFDTAAMATAFVVLSKLRLRTAMRTHATGAIEQSDESLVKIRESVKRAVEEMESRKEVFDNPFEDQPFPPGVCSGFVWQAYARTSTPLQPALLAGSRVVRGEIFGPPNVDPSLLDFLLDEAPKDAFGDGPLGGLKKALHELAPFLKATKVVLPTLIGTTLGNRRGTLLEMIGPGDLFCSADMSVRQFLSPEHLTTARDWQTEWDSNEVTTGDIA